MSTFLSILGLVGGLSGLLSVYRLAKSRGAADANVIQLQQRVEVLEQKQTHFEDRILTYVLDIRDRLGRIEGGLHITTTHNS